MLALYFHPKIFGVSVADSVSVYTIVLSSLTDSMDIQQLKKRGS